MKYDILPFGEIINRAFESIESPAFARARALSAAWDALLRSPELFAPDEGRALARHCRVTDFECGTLFISVDHPAAAELLRLRKKQLIKGLALKCPDPALKELAFVLKSADRNKVC